VSRPNPGVSCGTVLTLCSGYRGRSETVSHDSPLALVSFSWRPSLGCWPSFLAPGASFSISALPLKPLMARVVLCSVPSLRYGSPFALVMLIFASPQTVAVSGREAPHEQSLTSRPHRSSRHLIVEHSDASASRRTHSLPRRILNPRRRSRLSCQRLERECVSRTNAPTCGRVRQRVGKSTEEEKPTLRASRARPDGVPT
jgi:hypothetical protein